MLKRHLYLIVLGIIQFITVRSAGQLTMPDHVCTGETRNYYVIPGRGPGSTYKWWIDGIVMSGFTGNEFNYRWKSSNTYLLEVQELSADGCPGPKLSGQVFVNPQPEILISASDSLICDGESVTVSVQNPVSLIWGMWTYDLIVEPEAGITGNTISGTISGPADLNETLFNNDTALHKVVYRFTPRIVNDEGAQVCEGEEVKIAVWIYPGFRCKGASLEIPDAFSPNGDGINDTWNIKGMRLYPSARITIYNRWGQMVWRSERGYPVPWDGTRGYKRLPVDSYHYFFELNNGLRPLIGTVTLVR